MRKLLILFIILNGIFIITGCGNKENNDETPVISCAEDYTQEKCYDESTWDWEYNRTGFDGKGISVRVYTSESDEIDPNSVYYTGKERQKAIKRLSELEVAYNIDLQFLNYPIEASWGPYRIKWINDTIKSTDKEMGDIFLVSDNWISILAENESIAVLENVEYKNNKWEQNGGICSTLKFNISEKFLFNNINNKIYSYDDGFKHADYFLYYNQDLITKYNLDDPATLWNEGKWDYKTFNEFLINAENVFNKEEGAKIYGISGYDEEIILGFLTSHGQKLVDLEDKKVYFNDSKTLEIINKLKVLKNTDVWNSEQSRISSEFINGNQLFQPGKLWFLSSTMGFVSPDPENPTCDFQISVVPYPTDDGDAVNKENYKVPLTDMGTYVVRNVTNEDSSLTSLVLFNILDDFCRGVQKLIPSKEDPITNYKNKLSEIIKSNESVNALISIEENIDKYATFEYVDIVTEEMNKYGWNSISWGLGLLNEGTRTEYVLNTLQDKYQKQIDLMFNK